MLLNVFVSNDASMLSLEGRTAQIDNTILYVSAVRAIDSQFHLCELRTTDMYYFNKFVSRVSLSVARWDPGTSHKLCLWFSASYHNHCNLDDNNQAKQHFFQTAQ